MSKIEFVEKIDNKPPLDYYGDYPQGTEWTNWDIYRVTTDSGEEIYIKIGRTYNSYGSEIGANAPQICSPVQKTITVWQ